MSPGAAMRPGAARRSRRILNFQRLASAFHLFVLALVCCCLAHRDDDDLLSLHRLEENLGLRAHSLNASAALVLEATLTPIPSDEDASRLFLGDFGKAVALWKVLKRLGLVPIKHDSSLCADDSCANDPLAPYCLPLSGECVNCLTDGTCANPSFPFCLENNCVQCLADRTSGDGSCDANAARTVCGTTGALRGLCVECASNADCTSPNAVCDGGTCVQCIVDGDCPSAAARCSDTQVCETCSDESDCVLCPPNQVCTPLFQEVDTAVGAGRRRLMTHNEISRLSCRMCSEAGLQCTENRPFCNFGTCVQCTNDFDCGDAAPYCDEQGSCRPCADLTTSCLVRAAETVCSSDNDCLDPEDPRCDVSRSPSACVECLDSGDCDYPAAFCRQSDNVCVACLDNSHCGDPNPYCSAGNRCVSCLDDSQCSSPLPYCQTDYWIGECVQCTDSSQCPAGQPVCELEGYTCVECVDNSSCGGLNPFCDTSSYQCVPECRSDLDCPAEFPTCDPSGECVDPTPPPPPSCTTPGAPTNVRVDTTTDTGVIICWDAPTAAAQCTVDRYNIVLTDTDGGQPSPATTAGSVLCYDVLLPCDHNYEITVQSDSEEGGPGGTSSALAFSSASCSTCTTAPAAPGSLQAIPGSTGASSVSLDILWGAVADATEYSYFCVTSGGSCVDVAVGSGVGTTSSSTAGSVTSLDPYTSYTCWVKATNDCGSTCASSGATESTTCVAAPGAPTASASAGATSGSSPSLDITWSSVADATGYTYFCVPEGGACDDIDDAAGSGVGTTTGLSASVTSLDPYTSYTCWVKATNDCGSTCASSGATESTTCVAAPGAPTNLGTESTTVPGSSDSSVVITWDPVQDASGYKYFCVASGGSCSDTGSALGSGVGEINGVQTGPLSATVSSLAPSTTVTCFAVSTSACGETCTAGSTLTTRCSAAPSAPTTPSLTAPTGGVTMDMAWSAVTDPSVTKLEAFCTSTSVTSACPDPSVDSAPGSSVDTIETGISSAIAYTVTGLSPSTTYKCFVRITNACGTTCSTEATLSTECPPPGSVTAPSNVAAASDQTSGNLDVTWTGTSGYTYTVKCVDDTAGAGTCSHAAAGNGSVIGACDGSLACSATVTGLTDETPYLCCVVPNDSASCVGNPVGAAAAAKPCSTPVAATVNSVVSTNTDTLTLSWSPASNAVTYDYFCVADGGSCSSTPVGTGGSGVSSSPGAVTGLSAASYECFVRTVNSCGNTCSTGTPGVICALSAPSGLEVTGASDTTLDLSWTRDASAASYAAWCVAKVGSDAGTQTCADTPQGVGVVPVSQDTQTPISTTITGLSQNTEYVCYVKSIDGDGCSSPCSGGVGYITSVTGTSSLLVGDVPTLVYDDGAGPGSPLPLEKQPVSAYNELTCTNANEFPDQGGSERRALQVILNVEGWDKPSYEASVDIQAKFYQALSDLSGAIDTGPVCMRTFNVDNSRHGAGVKTRIWFDSQQDCIDFATYVRALWGPNGNGVLQTNDAQVFRDINFGANLQFDTATFGDLSLSSPYVGNTGGVTIRMITNPQSKCHKWKFPDAAVCTSQLNYFAAGSTTQPVSLTRNSDNVMCSDEENPSDMVESSNANAGFQVIFSLSGRDKLGPIGSGYVNDNPFAKNVVLAFKRYFATSGFEPKIMQVKALDNSAAGVGIHLRWFAAGADKSLCDGVATSIYANTPGATDAEKDIAAAWLFENVFKPYEVGVLGVAPGDYFGAVTRRASMPACRNVGGNSNLPAPTATVVVGQAGWAGDPMNVVPTPP